MKHLLIPLFLAAIFSSAFCQFAGYNQVAVLANDDPQSCLLTLKYQVFANKVTFTETVYNPFQDCTYQNLTFVSMFWGYWASGSVDLVQNPSNASQWVGDLTLQKLKDNNGTACFNAQPHGSSSVDVYVCRFAYGWNKLIEFFLAVDANTGVFQNWSGGFFPLYKATVLANQNNTVVWKTGNTTVTDVVGQLYRDCNPDTWSTRIPSGNNEVFVTGTVLSSNRISLQSIFTNITVFSVIVRKPGNPQNYHTTFVLNMAFNGAPANGVCSDLGKIYSQIVPGNMNYCSNGCEVTFYMQGFANGFPGLQTYALRTGGFTYAP
uniref:Predicted protein n=1 Tax=Hordeum vulgare subsp. vulgare TaxID=112509 RepID=F2DQH3_HORVV|nr:predicted protein [Hordeum vulgare subsp. vulgare]